MTTMSGLTSASVAEQQVAAARFVGVVDRLARRVGQSGKSLVGRRDRRQRQGRDPRPGKARHRRAAGHHGHREPVFGERAGDAAGAGEVADAEQMLDIEEDARAAHGVVCHSCSNRPSAGGCCCGSRSAGAPLLGRRAEPLAQCRVADRALQRCGQRRRILGRHDKPVLAVVEQFRHAGNVVEMQTSPWLDASTSTLGRPSRSPSPVIRQASAKMSACR